MGFKRALTIVLSMMLVVTLITACGIGGIGGGRFDLTDEVMIQNLQDATGIENEVAKSVVTTSTEGLTVILGQSYLNAGLVAVSNTAAEVGIRSLVTGTLIIPFTAAPMSITYQADANFGVYIIIEWTTPGTESVYDMFGKLVLAEAEYHDYSIESDVVEEYDMEGELVATHYSETIKYVTQANFVLNNLEPTVIYNTIDPVARTRTVATYDTYAWNDVYDDKVVKLGLGRMGLKDYYSKTYGTTSYIYKKSNNALVNMLVSPVATIQAAFDGQLFYQTTTAVSDFATDYTYSTGTNKFKIETASIDLLDGKKTYYDVDYKISDIDAFANKDGVFNNARIKIQLITDKILLTEKTFEYITNKSGKLLKDITEYNFDNLRLLNDTHIINVNAKAIYDMDMNALVKLPGVYSVNLTEEIVTFAHEGLFGAINYNGQVVIPFAYSALNTNFKNGATYGMTWGKRVLVNVDNTKVTISDNIAFLAGGSTLLRPLNTNTLTGLYDCTIVDYNNTTLASISINNTTSTNHNLVSEYGNFSFYRYGKATPAPAHYIYIAIEVIDGE